MRNALDYVRYANGKSPVCVTNGRLKKQKKTTTCKENANGPGAEENVFFFPKSGAKMCCGLEQMKSVLNWVLMYACAPGRLENCAKSAVRNVPFVRYSNAPWSSCCSLIQRKGGAKNTAVLKKLWQSTHHQQLVNSAPTQPVSSMFWHQLRQSCRFSHPTGSNGVGSVTIVMRLSLWEVMVLGLSLLEPMVLVCHYGDWVTVSYTRNTLPPNTVLDYVWQSKDGHYNQDTQCALVFQQTLDY